MIEDNDKCLKLDLCFKLPKDFNGDLNDALQILLEYRRSDKFNDIKNIGFNEDPNLDTWSNWWNMVNTTDKNLYANYSISKFDGKNFN